jgi:hypothetical protein
LSINFENSKERINKIKPKKIVHPLQKKKKRRSSRGKKIVHPFQRKVNEKEVGKLINNC